MECTCGKGSDFTVIVRDAFPKHVVIFTKQENVAPDSTYVAKLFMFLDIYHLSKSHIGVHNWGGDMCAVNPLPHPPLAWLGKH